MLKEISIIRPILIVLLVAYHSFIIYGGGWEQPVGFIEIPIYKNIVWWTYSFMLESFTFISGYVWLYTCHTKGTGSLLSLIQKKAKRLLVPMLVFGLLYFICFMDYKSYTGTIYEVLNGAGHMWYLAMLFWCFVEAWILMHIKLDEHIKLLCIALLAIFCSEFPLPFRIGTSFYYLFFFYLPVLLVAKREEIYLWVKAHTFSTLSMAWIAFAASFILIRYEAHFPHLVENLTLVEKEAVLSLNKAMQMLYSILGVIAFYLTAVAISGTAEPTSRNSTLVMIGNYCFGVYIFQQFFLKWLYFDTPVPRIVGPYLLPWVGFVFALALSFASIYLIRLTKVGRAYL